MTNGDLTPWRVVHVEDQKHYRDAIVEAFEGKRIYGRPIVVHSVAKFEDAAHEVLARRVDLLILDQRLGDSPADAAYSATAGIDLFKSLRARGFACTVFYTALPESIPDALSPFVRVVSKDQPASVVTAAVESLFDTRVPQLHRAIASHVDRVLRTFMWDVVEERWTDFQSIAALPDFGRVVLSRIAASLPGEGADSVVREVYGEAAASSAGELVHPSRLYVIPPLSPKQVQLGDIRRRTRSSKYNTSDMEYVVTIWPSCDTVSTGDRKPKTTIVFCAIATELAHDASVQSAVAAAPKNLSQIEKIDKMIRNQDAKLPEKHVLPGTCGIPDLLLDFRRIEVCQLAEVEKYECLATLVSPYSESLSSRFLGFLGRIGVDDVATSVVLSNLGL